MPLIRMLMPLGLIFFGAVAMFMGAVVLFGGLRAGEIGWSSGPAGAVTETRIRKADDPDGFWWVMGLGGTLPLVLGFVAVVGGRRLLRS